MTEKRKRIIKYVCCGLFVLFTMNKCTTSCTRGTQIDRLNDINISYVSQIDSLHKLVDLLTVRVEGLSAERERVDAERERVNAEREKVDAVNQQLNDKNMNTVAGLQRKVREQQKTINRLTEELKAKH